MSLIDQSYFVGELNIPNTGTEAIQERLVLFIENCEPEFLRQILGYPLYKAFIQGLTGMPIAQKWIDLLQGVEYTNLSNRLTRWRGLITLPPDQLNTITVSSEIEVVVGRGTKVDPISLSLLDPVAGTSSAPLPTALIGKQFIIEQRGVGQLRSDEWSIVDNNIVIDPLIFANGDTYFYKASTFWLNTLAGTIKRSLIANYIYWRWQKDQVTQTIGLGEAATKAENATMVSPMDKMISANNEMVDILIEMCEYLDTNRTTYPEWQDQDTACLFSKFWYQNRFGI